MLRLTPEDANAISEIECLLTFRETGKDLVLGTDNKLTRDWEGNEVKGEKFTLTEEPYIKDTALPAGDYIYYFRLKAPHNEPVLTEGVEFQVDEAAKAA